MEKTFNKISLGISILVQMSQNIIYLNKKLLFLLLYFNWFVYIFAKFTCSYLYLWLLGILLFSKSWKRFFVNILLTELVGLIIRSISTDTIEGILSKKCVIGVFFNLKLI